MGYGTDGLTFNTLRRANAARLPQFKNKWGCRAHALPDGSDWSPAQWLQAVVGELGEYANQRKKYERGDIGFEEFKTYAHKELADIQVYFDILCRRALDGPDVVTDCLQSEEGRGTVQFTRVLDPHGVDLGRAVMDKFNEVSERVGSNVFMDADDWHYQGEPRPFTDEKPKEST